MLATGGHRFRRLDPVIQISRVDLEIVGHALPEIFTLAIVTVTLSTGIGLSNPVSKKLDIRVNMTVERLE